MDISIPPRDNEAPVAETPRPRPDLDIRVENLVATNSSLTVLPKDGTKAPLHFKLERARLEPAGNQAGMRYDAALTNSSPPGVILAK
jgi:hypothetical protein